MFRSIVLHLFTPIQKDDWLEFFKLTLEELKMKSEEMNVFKDKPDKQLNDIVDDLVTECDAKFEDALQKAKADKAEKKAAQHH